MGYENSGNDANDRNQKGGQNTGNRLNDQDTRNQPNDQDTKYQPIITNATIHPNYPFAKNSFEQLR